MNSERFKRQDFLGEKASERIRQVKIGVVGLGGGGSHIVQQLAHVGFRKWLVCDGDCVEESNLNRLVGATGADARDGVAKVKIAARVIRKILPDAEIQVVPTHWQQATGSLCHCDVIFGGVDTFAGRHELEAFCRQHMIPLIDVGLDVHEIDGEPPRMTGQVILSLPGEMCMHCLGFLTPEKLTREAMKYGNGSRPQVVWANGVLASTAVGLAVDLVTNWTHSLTGSVYVSYDANIPTLMPHVRWLALKGKTCPHYPIASAGAPKFMLL